jgi:hypothetical protein
LTTSRRSDALAEEHGQVDDDLVQEARVGALLDDVGRTGLTMPSPTTAAACATALTTPSVTKLNEPSATLWVTTKTGTLRDLTPR